MMPTKIKVCGVTVAGNAARVAAAGVEFVGLNFWPRSKRYLAPDHAPPIAAAARGAGAVELVGVFVDPTLEEILAVTAVVALDVIQLHGDEDPAFVSAVAVATGRPVWKALSIATREAIETLARWPSEAILLDAPGALIRHATPDGGSAVVPGPPDDARCDGDSWTLAREARRRHPALKLVVAGGLHPANVRGAIAAVEPWCVDVASGVEAAPGIKDPDKVAAFVAAVRAAR